MTDWADELASRLYSSHPSEMLRNIATALRKASEEGEKRGRAKGLREASYKCDTIFYLGDIIETNIGVKLRDQADAIEKGEAIP